jgi:pimeloyl-ACP methyl ester carboxylesterase
MTERASATFVVVHGAWTGGWSWQRVIDRLHAKGHRAFAPTLTGLCERSHLASDAVNLDTHIADIVNEITWKDLEGIVLVAHSYGGMVATGVAEKIADRIASIVYVDAFIPDDNQSFLDMVPSWRPEGPLIEAQPSSPGDYLNEADRSWVDGKATPQPAGTFRQKPRVTGAYQRIARKTFVEATGWDGFRETAERLRADPSWTVRQVACGHDVAIDAPDDLVRILDEAVPT